MHGRLSCRADKKRGKPISAETDITLPLARSSRMPFVRGLPAWLRSRPIRTRLLLVFMVIDLLAGALGGAVMIFQARLSTRVEIAASMELAQLLVSEAVGLMQQEVPAEKFLADLSSPLRLVRHVRIVVKDAAGASLALHAAATAADAADEPRAPAWFAALIMPAIAGREVPVVVDGQRIGSVEIVAEPRDEIAEAWGNTVALAQLALVVNVAVILVLYVLFGRALDPLTGVAQGLADLEQRKYRVRLPRPQVQELAAITDRFNALAHALDAARTENEMLNRRLITAQDDERRKTALELHDEVGPSLFGLKANASSIASVAAGLPEPAAGKLKARLTDMQGIIEHLQAVNRSMLNRLRPMALGHVPLRDILGELVRDRARQHPHIAFALTADKLMPSYGDSIDLTIYRCVQESLTNVIRHAQANEASVALSQAPGDASGEAPRLLLTVRDDGCGFDSCAPAGFGRRGMQERVHALGGSYKLETGAGRGTCVRIAIPLPGAI